MDCGACSIASCGVGWNGVRWPELECGVVGGEVPLTAKRSVFSAYHGTPSQRETGALNSLLGTWEGGPGVAKILEGSSCFASIRSTCVTHHDG